MKRTPYHPTVQVVWADGRRQHTVAGGLADYLIMPVDNARGGWSPVTFVREIVKYPENWHGPFESEFWIDRDVNRAKMVRYTEEVSYSLDIPPHRIVDVDSERGEITISRPGWWSSLRWRVRRWWRGLWA